MVIMGQRLKAVRKDYKLTQAAIADILHIQVRNYASWEHGKSEPPLYLLREFCSRFNVSADYLLGLTEEAQLSDTNEYYTHADLTPLSLESRMEALNFIRFLTERENNLNKAQEA